jgi:WD40 repeat protein
LRQGVAVLRKRFPKSSLYEQLACLLACAERDRAAAVELFELIGSRPRPDVWASSADYERIRLAIERQETDQAKKLIDAGIQAPVALDASREGETLLLARRAALSGVELYAGDFASKPRVLPIAGEVTSAAINPAGDSVAVGVKGQSGYRLETWDLKKNERKQSQFLHEPCVRVCYSADGKYIAHVCPRRVAVWDRDLTEALVNLNAPRYVTTDYSMLSFAPNGEHFVFGGFTEPVRFYRWEHKSHVPLMPNLSPVHQLVAGSQYAYLAGAGGSLYQHDLEIFKPITLREFDQKRARCQVTALALSRNGNLLASGHLDENGRAVLELWNVRQVGARRELHGHTGPIRHLTFLGNKRLASAADDGTVRIWDASD